MPWESIGSLVGTSSVTSPVLTFSRAPAVGAMVRIIVKCQGSRTVTIPGYTTVDDIRSGPTSASSRIYLLQKDEPADGTETGATLTFATGSSFHHAEALEFVDYEDDIGAAYSDAGATSLATEITAPTFDTTAANAEVFLVAGSNTNSGTIDAPAMTVSAGFTDEEFPASTTRVGLYIARKTQAVAGAAGAGTWSIDGATAIGGGLAAMMFALNPTADPAPNLAVTGPAGALADGGTDAAGTVTEDAVVTRTYTITNNGSASDTIGTVAVGAGLTITDDPSGAVIAAAGTDTLTVQIDTSVVGAFNATVSIPSLDATTPYNWTVTATVQEVGGGAPATPTGLAGTPLYLGNRLAWDASGGATNYKLFRAGTQVYSGALLTFDDFGLAAGVAVPYTVLAESGAGASAQSAAVNSTPTATLTVTASDGGGGGTFSDSTIELTEAGYVVTGITYTNATPDTYTLSFTNNGNFADPANITHVVGAVDVTAPVVSNVSAGTPGERGVTIEWDTDEDASTRVEFGLTAAYGTTTNTFDDGTPGNPRVTAHSVDLSDLEPDTLYHYRVISADTAGNTTTDSDRTFTTAADVTAPAAPTGVTATAGNLQVLVEWSPNSEIDLASYDVYRAAASAGTYTKINAVAVIAPAYVDTGAPAGVAAFYKLKALDTTGNASAFSAVVSATPIGEPVGQSPVIGTGEHWDQFLTRLDRVLVAATDRSVTVYRNLDPTTLAPDIQSPIVGWYPYSYPTAEFVAGDEIHDVQTATIPAPTASDPDRVVTLVRIVGYRFGGEQEGVGNGDGDIPIDHNTGGADALRYTVGGDGADSVAIRAYLQTEYDAGSRIARGTTFTGSDGRWVAPLMLDADSYYLVAQIPGVTQPTVTPLEVA